MDRGLYDKLMEQGKLEKTTIEQEQYMGLKRLLSSGELHQEVEEYRKEVHGLTTAELEYLQALQREVMIQPNESTALPLYYVIYDVVEVESTTDYDRVGYYSFELFEDGLLPREELYKNLDSLGYLNTLNEEEQQGLKDLLEDEDTYPELGEYLDEYTYKLGIDITEHTVREEYREVGDSIFVTREEAENYLKNQRHNYTSKAYVYCKSGVYSSNYNLLLKLLLSTDIGEKLQEQYMLGGGKGVNTVGFHKQKNATDLIEGLEYLGTGKYKVLGGITKSDLSLVLGYTGGKGQIVSIDLVDVEGYALPSSKADSYTNLIEVLDDTEVDVYSVTLSNTLGEVLYYITFYSDGKVVSRGQQSGTEEQVQQEVLTLLGTIIRSKGAK